MILHVSPEAQAGGTLALVKTGDRIKVSASQGLLELMVDEAELATRRAQWVPEVSPYTRGYAKLYIDHVLQADQGAKVAFCQRSDATAFCDAMEATTQNRPLFLPCDITDLVALQAALAAAAEAHGPITVLVNNAANDQRHKTLETDEAFFDWSIAINLKAYFFAAKAVIPAMQAAGGGAIINFSSISYMMGNAGYPVYTASNSAINGLTRSLAREFGPDRIRVNALAPGWVLTQKQKDKWVTPEGLAAHLARQCIPDPLEPEDIVGGCLFLASTASKAMTGQALVIDGGVVVTG